MYIYWFKLIILVYTFTASVALAVNATVTDEHAGLITLIGIITAGIVAFITALHKWVVEPTVQKNMQDHNINEDAHLNLVMDRKEEFHKLMDTLNESIKKFTSTIIINGEKLDALIKEHNDIRDSPLCKAAHKIDAKHKRAGDPETFDPSSVRTNIQHLTDDLETIFDLTCLATPSTEEKKLKQGE